MPDPTAAPGPEPALDTEALRWSEAEHEADTERRDALDQREVERLSALAAEASRASGPDHPDALAARRDLVVYARQHPGCVERLLGLADPLAADCLRVLGPDDQVTIAVLAVQAAERLDEYEETAAHEAPAVLASLVERQTRLLGPGHPETLRLRRRHVDCVCRAYRLTRRTDHEPPGADGPRRLLRLWGELAADHAEALGADHPDTFACRDEEAAEYCEFGEHDGEVRCYAALAADRARVLGPYHPDTLGSRESHLTSLAETGRPEEAAESARARPVLVADCVRALGRDHRITQFALES
ncbi:hypothetical protein AB0I22_37345 [Streptomyces sp. NPDC050610]|uniref:hypothetical protein n=1 Tax=Streptomyces sp. NPDC050610 TaxID=3157097 RepID=UPI0034332833